MGEIRLPVVGWEGLYEVSHTGLVKTLRRGWKGELLKQATNRNGYKYVALYKNLIPLHMLVHRLVGMAFIDNSEGKPHINHINGIRDDNNIDNLERCTRKENMRHAFHVLGTIDMPRRKY